MPKTPTSPNARFSACDGTVHTIDSFRGAFGARNCLLRTPGPKPTPGALLAHATGDPVSYERAIGLFRTPPRRNRELFDMSTTTTSAPVAAGPETASDGCGFLPRVEKVAAR